MRPAVHGHRGARAVLPENTIPAFEYAIAAGVDAIEMDLAVTRDNVVVVSHDPYLPDRALIRELTPAQVPKFPTLNEALALASRGEFLFNLEIKSFPDRPEFAPPPEEFARLVLAAIREHGLERRAIVQSFDFRTLRAMKSLAPEIRLGALWAGGERDFVSVAREAGTAIVGPEHHLVTPERVRDAHAAGLEVICWTANTPQNWDGLIAAHVDAIVTDDPAALIAYLDHSGPIFAVRY